MRRLRATATVAGRGPRWPGWLRRFTGLRVRAARWCGVWCRASGLRWPSGRGRTRDEGARACGGARPCCAPVRWVRSVVRGVNRVSGDRAPVRCTLGALPSHNRSIRFGPPERRSRDPRFAPKSRLRLFLVSRQENPGDGIHDLLEDAYWILRVSIRNPGSYQQARSYNLPESPTRLRSSLDDLDSAPEPYPRRLARLMRRSDGVLFRSRAA